MLHQAPSTSGLRAAIDVQLANAPSMTELHRIWVRLRTEHWAARYKADDLSKTDPRKAQLDQCADELETAASRVAAQIMALPKSSSPADLLVLLDLAIVYDGAFAIDPKGRPGEYQSGVHTLRFLEEMQKLAPEVQLGGREDALTPEQLKRLAA